MVATASYQGPAILAGGYRIFFFLAALWAFVSLTLWVSYLAGLTAQEANVDVLLWHGHALIYGYSGAVVAGFALTAIPNWTGRLPVRGWLLFALVLPWLVARFAELLSLYDAAIPELRVAGEMLFFLLFVGIAAREVIAGKNWRNIKIVVFFAAFMVMALLSNLDRLEVITLPFSGWMLGLAVILTLISVIGGRIIPAFTGNWMRQQRLEPLPVMFNKFDALTILVTIGALVSFIGAWSVVVTGVSATIAGVLHLVRLARWRGWKTGKSPIVTVLHVSYLWVPIGFGLLALASFGVGEADV
ncbi:MAG: NnrS family protein, partial [Kordiimonas sp.]